MISLNRNKESMETSHDTSADSISEIQSFFKDSSVFITGVTGFLGHVLIAKLLKCCPDINKIYVLLRNKRGISVQERFKSMLEDEVFSVLKSEYPHQLQKVHAIAGDCLEPKLGMNEEDIELLKNDVNIVFHVAATVKFDAPLKYAAYMNVRATSDLLDLAQEMKQLKSFVYVSTAFSNCVDRKEIKEKLYAPPIPADKLMMMVDNLDEVLIDRMTPSILGMYPNTYIFTKAVAESLCNIKGKNLPLAIFRPAIVISSVQEPISGWINNVYGPTGVSAATAVGLLRTLHMNKNCKANIVPCDYAVNAAIALAWNIGTKSSDEQLAFNGIIMNNNNADKLNGKLPNGKVEEKCNGITDDDVPRTQVNGQLLNGNLPNGNKPRNNSNDIVEAEEYDLNKILVHNYSCDIMKKPFTWKEYMKMTLEQEPIMPSSQSIWPVSLTMTTSETLYKLFCFLLHIIPAFFADTTCKILGREPKLMDAYQKLHKFSKVLSYFSMQEWKMSNDNVWSMWNRLSQKDREIFDFNMNNIDWGRYYYEHCRGLRLFILKESSDDIPYAKKRRILLLILHYTLISVVSVSSFLILLKVGQFLLK